MIKENFTKLFGIVFLGLFLITLASASANVTINYPYHMVDLNKNFIIEQNELTVAGNLYTSGTLSLTQMTRVVQFANYGGYHTQDGTEDGFAPGLTEFDVTQNYPYYFADLNDNFVIDEDEHDYATELYEDGVIDLHLYLRVVQFYNSGGYHIEQGTEDGFAPGLKDDDDDDDEEDDEDDNKDDGDSYYDLAYRNDLARYYNLERSKAQKEIRQVFYVEEPEESETIVNVNLGFWVLILIANIVLFLLVLIAYAVRR